MEKVRVTRSDLLKVVTENREKHKAEFEAAWIGYKQTCIEILEQNLAAFKVGKAQHILFNEVPPQDHTRDYDRILRMLNMSIDATIELDEEHFQQYVMDDWNWKQHWQMSNTKYVTKARSSAPRG